MKHAASSFTAAAFDGDKKMSCKKTKAGRDVLTFSSLSSFSLSCPLYLWLELSPACS